MNGQHPDNSDSLPVSAAMRIDAICERFEAAWNGGQQPRIECYLGGVSDTERSQLLRELLKVDLEYRRKKGETPKSEGYLARFPDDVQSIKAVFLEINAARFHSLLASGQRPSIEDFLAGAREPDRTMLLEKLLRSEFKHRVQQ